MCVFLQDFEQGVATHSMKVLVGVEFSYLKADLMCNCSRLEAGQCKLSLPLAGCNFKSHPLWFIPTSTKQVYTKILVHVELVAQYELISSLLCFIARIWLFGTHCHESIIFLQYCGLYMCSIFGWQVKRFWRGNCLLDKQMSVFTFVHAFVCPVLCAVPNACRCIRLLNGLICILLAMMPYTPQMWHFVGRKVYSADSFQRLPILFTTLNLCHLEETSSCFDAQTT